MLTFSPSLTQCAGTDPKRLSQPAHAASAAATHTPRMPRWLPPPASAGGPEHPDSSATGGRSLVPCFHVILSQTGRGDGLCSLSARTTTPASPVEEPLGRRRLDSGGTWGVAAAGPRPPLPSSGGRQLPLRPEREPTAGGRSCSLSASGDWWAPHRCFFSPPRPRTWWPRAL